MVRRLYASGTLLWGLFGCVSGSLILGLVIYPHHGWQTISVILGFFAVMTWVCVIPLLCSGLKNQWAEGNDMIREIVREFLPQGHIDEVLRARARTYQESCSGSVDLGGAGKAQSRLDKAYGMVSSVRANFERPAELAVKLKFNVGELDEYNRTESE